MRSAFSRPARLRLGCYSKRRDTEVLSNSRNRSKVSSLGTTPASKKCLQTFLNHSIYSLNEATSNKKLIGIQNLKLSREVLSISEHGVPHDQPVWRRRHRAHVQVTISSFFLKLITTLQVSNKLLLTFQ